MPNIRVNDLCEGFKSLKYGEIPPELLNLQLKTLCAVSKGNPDVLETNEAKAVDRTSGKLFSEYGGVYEFAKVMTNTAIANPVPDSLWSDVTLAKLYEGFLEIPVSEPPFVVGEFKIDKIAENMETGVQTLLVNDDVIDDVIMDITPEKAAFKIEVTYEDLNSCCDCDNIGKALPRFNNAQYLPIMPQYDAEDLYNTRYARLEEPVGASYFAGKIKQEYLDKVYERDVYVDDRGLFFFDIGINESINESFGNRRAYFAEMPRSYDAFGFENIALGRDQQNTYSDYIAEKRRKEEKGWLFGACFTGDMNLETDSGAMATFENLYNIYRTGDELPYVRVWNSEENSWTYQQPERVLRHLLPYSGVVRLIQVSGNLLKVTPNHFLWARRGEEELWLRAGEIKVGDHLLTDTQGGGEKVWSEVSANFTMNKHEYLASIGLSDETTLEVFNLTFGKGIGQYFNYAVCGNSGECAVAHNEMK